jgi:hypothetical protein
MYTNIKLGIMLYFLLILVPTFLSENLDTYYNSAYNSICSDKDGGCLFLVTHNFPISPKVPTFIPTKAILGSYKYIYLTFYIPSNPIQKNFYLEAYDTSTGETIITNGDCYFINTTENIDYEIRIFKELQRDSYVQFRFFGLLPNFKMMVLFRFSLSVHLYFNDIALSYDNSLNENNIPELVDYKEKMDEKLIEQKDRKEKAKKTIVNIMKKIFNTDIDITLFDDSNFLSSISMYIPPCFEVTISYAVGLELSTEPFFEPESTELSETTVLKGEIVDHASGLSLLNEKINIDNGITKLLSLFNISVENLALSFGEETDYYTVTVSINSKLNIVFTLRFYYENTKTIYYEIEIVIKFINKDLLDLALNYIVVNAEEINKALDQIIIGEIIFFLVAIILVPLGSILGLGFKALAAIGIKAHVLEAASAAMLMLPLLSNEKQTNLNTTYLD